MKRKCEWERFWDVDKEEGRERGGSFLILQSASEEGREGVACVEVWVSQGWAVAAGSWALTTYVLQPQPEL